MVYLGILDTRKFLGSQKILTEITAIVSRFWNNYLWFYTKCCVQGIFFRKCHMPLLDRKCIAITGIFHYTGGAKKLLLHHKSYLFCCFLVKSQVTEYFLPFSPIFFCKTANMFQYDRKVIISWSLSFLLISYKVPSNRKFSASQSDFFL